MKNSYNFVQHGYNFSYSVEKSRRKTIAIHVGSDGEVRVKSPLFCSKGRIDEFIASKASWISGKIKYFSQRQQAEAENQLRFMGKLYEIEVELGLRNELVFEAERIRLISPHPRDTNKLREFLDAWLKQQAKDVFTTRMQVCLERAAKIAIYHSGDLKLRDMKSRWGSCSALGEITLNLQLIKAAEICIDYVILHELCHLRELNHSPAFYALLSKLMPNWKQVRNELNNTAISKKARQL